MPGSLHTRAHTCAGIVRRLCGWLGARKRHARFESSEALAEGRAAGSGAQCRGAASMLRPGCRLLRRSSVNILTAWPGRVAQAPRAGRARALWSCSPCWRPSREPHGSSFQGPATARRQSELDNRAPTGRCHRQPPFGVWTRVKQLYLYLTPQSTSLYSQVPG